MGQKHPISMEYSQRDRKQYCRAKGYGEDSDTGRVRMKGRVQDEDKSKNLLNYTPDSKEPLRKRLFKRSLTGGPEEQNEERRTSRRCQGGDEAGLPNAGAAFQKDGLSKL